MKLYADTTARRTRQIVWDVLAIAFIALWVWIGVQVHDAINQLGVVGTKMESVGSSLNGDLNSIADKLGSVPLIGDGIRAPFESAADAATSVEEAGTWQRETVEKIALFTSIGLVIGPIFAVFAIWILPRWWWVRRASRVQRAASAVGGVELLALRALVERPMDELLLEHPDPARAWREGDREVIAALARLECRSIGISTDLARSSVGA